MEKASTQSESQTPTRGPQLLADKRNAEAGREGEAKGKEGRKGEKREESGYTLPQTSDVLTLLLLGGACTGLTVLATSIAVQPVLQELKSELRAVKAGMRPVLQELKGELQ